MSGWAPRFLILGLARYEQSLRLKEQSHTPVEVGSYLLIMDQKVA